MKRTIAAILIATALSSAADAQQKRMAVVDLSAIYMRQQPDYESALETQEMMGTVVEIVGEKGYWREIVSPQPYRAWATEKGLVEMTAEELAPLRAGFRNKYIVDAVQKLCSGEINLEKIKTMPIEEARLELMKIKGVGAKVAECTLLYGFGRMEAFPVDVWVKKIMAEMYPDGLPECCKNIEGIAQQYLFHWRRNSDLFKDKE